MEVQVRRVTHRIGWNYSGRPRYARNGRIYRRFYAPSHFEHERIWNTGRELVDRSVSRWTVHLFPYAGTQTLVLSEISTPSKPNLPTIDDALSFYAESIANVRDDVSIYYSERPDETIDIWTLIPKLNNDLEDKIVHEQVKLMSKYPFKFDFMILGVFGRQLDAILPKEMKKVSTDSTVGSAWA